MPQARSRRKYEAYRFGPIKKFLIPPNQRMMDDRGRIKKQGQGIYNLGKMHKHFQEVLLEIFPEMDFRVRMIGEYMRIPDTRGNNHGGKQDYQGVQDTEVRLDAQDKNLCKALEKAGLISKFLGRMGACWDDTKNPTPILPGNKVEEIYVVRVFIQPRLLGGNSRPIPRPGVKNRQKQLTIQDCLQTTGTRHNQDQTTNTQQTTESSSQQKEDEQAEATISPNKETQRSSVDKQRDLQITRERVIDEIEARTFCAKAGESVFRKFLKKYQAWNALWTFQ